MTLADVALQADVEEAESKFYPGEGFGGDFLFGGVDLDGIGEDGEGGRLVFARVFAVDLEALAGSAIQSDFHGVVKHEGAFFQPLGDGGDHVSAEHLENGEDAGGASDTIDSENPKADVERVAGVGDDGEGPEKGPGVGVTDDTEGQVTGGFGGTVSVSAPHIDGGWVFAGAAPRPVGDANIAQGCGGKAAAAGPIHGGDDVGVDTEAGIHGKPVVLPNAEVYGAFEVVFEGMGECFGSMDGFGWEAEGADENISGAGGDDREGGDIGAGGGCWPQESVDDLVDGAVTADCDHHVVIRVGDIAA